MRGGRQGDDKEEKRECDGAGPRNICKDAGSWLRVRLAPGGAGLAGGLRGTSVLVRSLGGESRGTGESYVICPLYVSM
jgi:hypothetical protein